jgi:hypothetical protein
VNLEQFRLVQVELGWTHAQTAEELGLSEISVKRIATGAQVITESTARVLVASLLVHREGMTMKYQKLLDAYHRDTTQVSGTFDAAGITNVSEEISICGEAPETVRIPALKLRVGHVHVFRNPGGSWSLERVREIYEVTEGTNGTVSVGLGPVGHACRVFFKKQLVDITRVSSDA